MPVGAQKLVQGSGSLAKRGKLTVGDTALVGFLSVLVSNPFVSARVFSVSLFGELVGTVGECIPSIPSCIDVMEEWACAFVFIFADAD